MSDLLERAATRSPITRGSSPAAASPSATCSAPARVGRSRFCITPDPRQFAAFFARGDTFALGVCNGCQMLAPRRADSGCGSLAALPA